MRLFHPLGFMLASPVETPEEAVERFTAKPAKKTRPRGVPEGLKPPAGGSVDGTAEAVPLAQPLRRQEMQYWKWPKWLLSVAQGGGVS